MIGIHALTELFKYVPLSKSKEKKSYTVARTEPNRSPSCHTLESACSKTSEFWSDPGGTSGRLRRPEEDMLPTVLRAV